MAALRDQIIAVMRRAEVPLTSEEVHARGVGKDAEKVACALRSMVRDRLVYAVSGGRFATLAWVIDRQQKAPSVEPKPKPEPKPEPKPKPKPKPKRAVKDLGYKRHVLARLEAMMAPDIAEVLASIREDLSKL